jgi:protein tyrosine/serine phosphatase
MAEETHHRPWQLKFHFHHKEIPKSAKDPARKTSISDHGAISQRKHPPAGQTLRLDFTQNIPLNLPYPPFINVEGVPNFRDIGGFACIPPTAPPAFPNTALHVRQGLVYRCSELSQITPAGNVTMVESLRIKTLYDFRSEAEAANPRGHPQGVHCISVPVFRKTDVTYTMSVQQLQWSTAPDKKNAGYSQGYVDWYRQIAVYGAKSSFRVCFAHLRDKPDEPFVYHCSAGKDRTGVFSALVLKLCGVEDAVVAWEYSLTVPGMGVWEAMVEQEMVGDSMMPIRSHGGMTAEEAQRVCGSRASNMARWLKVVLEKEFGGVEKYMVEKCGFTKEDVEKIRNNLLVPGEGTVKVVDLPASDDHPQT